MKFKDIRALNDTELNDKLFEAKKELIKSNGQVATGTTPKNPGQIKQTKKAVARILTAMSQKKRENKQ